MTRARTDAWPTVTFERHDWQPGERVLAHLPVFTQHRISRPYRAAVAGSIAALTPTLPPETLALVDEATATVSRFDEFMAHQPTPMPAVLLRSESATSSQIEQLTASARNLAMASLGVSDRQNASLVAANVRAMQSALEFTGSIDNALILRVHDALLGNSEPEAAGKIRHEQVWIGGTSFSPHDADFVPPHHGRLAGALDDLAAFADRGDISALVHAAIHHAQFETIHPFTDGNGRTGRVLLQTLLRRRGLIEHVTLPVSAGLLADVTGYYRALNAYRDGDIAPIVEQVAQGAMTATVNARILSEDLGVIRESWLSANPAREGSAARALIDLIFAQPVVNAEWVRDRLGVSDTAAYSAIKTLVDAGILAPSSAARRSRVWQASDVLAAADAFAARARKRVRNS